MLLNKKYIWDYNVRSLDLKKPEVLLWYLQRKVEYGDWESIDIQTLKKYLPKLKIDPFLKKILQGFVRKYGGNLKRVS